MLLSRKSANTPIHVLYIHIFICVSYRVIQNPKLTQVIQNHSIYYSAYSMVSVSNDSINSIVQFYNKTMLILSHTSNDADFYRRLQTFHVKHDSRQADRRQILLYFINSLML